MKIDAIKKHIPEELYKVIVKEGITELRPSQQKAIVKGLLTGNSILVCTPTASGKTLIAELAAMKAVLEKKGKAVYIVPLKALASEKYKDFKNKYGDFARVALSIGDIDSSETYLAGYDVIITTSEKLDSMMRHHTPWISDICTVIVDEVHLLNDPGRGPTLEILITMLKEMLLQVQFIALSATIGNPEQLATWLGAELVIDTWRPVALKKGIYKKGKIMFE